MSLSKQLRRKWYGWTVNKPFAQQLLAKPYPSLQQTFDKATVAVVDIETTGLDTSVAEIASIGWVLVENGVVKLNTLHHILVQVQNGVQQSAAIHEIFDSELDAYAISCEQALRRLLNACAHLPIVVHGAQLDNAMLSKAMLAHFGLPLLQPIIDTLELERRRSNQQKGYIEHGSLRLHACRDRYGLPHYSAHNAAIDALATAELLMAIVAYRGGASKVRLKELLSHA